MDNLAIGFILLGERGKVIHANRKAAKLLAANDGLQVLHGYLRAGRGHESDELQHLILQAQATSMEKGLGPGGAMKISRRAEPALLVLITPVRNIAFTSPVPVYAIALISDPSQKSRPAAEAFNVLFDLTPAGHTRPRAIARSRKPDRLAPVRRSCTVCNS